MRKIITVAILFILFIPILKAETIEKFVYNFRTIKGTAHNFQNFIFLRGVHK